MLNIDELKELYCKYNCNAKEKQIFVQIDTSMYCDECNSEQDICTLEETELGEEVCKVCQVNNFINELKVNKII